MLDENPEHAPGSRSGGARGRGVGHRLTGQQGKMWLVLMCLWLIFKQDRLLSEIKRRRRLTILCRLSYPCPLVSDPWPLIRVSALNFRNVGRLLSPAGLTGWCSAGRGGEKVVISFWGLRRRGVIVSVSAYLLFLPPGGESDVWWRSPGPAREILVPQTPR